MLKTLTLLILSAIVMASVACSSNANIEEHNSSEALKTFNVTVYPEGTGTILLNPAPVQSNKYQKGDHIYISVVPKTGWQVRKWIGPPNLDSYGNEAKLEITTSSNVVARMSRLDGSDATVKPPIFEKIDLGGDTIWLEPAGCNNEYFERVTLQEGDRVDLSVTAARMVTIVVKSPHAGRKTVGKSDKFHEISYQAMSDGTHILIIVADYAQQAYLQCNKRASQVEYEYTVYRPTTN